MEEIWKMWKIVRIFKKNRNIWALKLIESDVAQEGNKAVLEQFRDRQGDVTDDEAQKAVKEQEEINEWRIHRATNSYNKEPVVERRAVINTYIFSYHKEFCTDEENSVGFKDLNDKNFKQTRLEATSMIQSCIDEEHGFIKEEPNDKSRIYLTGRGKKFAGVDGLIKEEGEYLIKNLGWTISLVLFLAFGCFTGFVTRNFFDLLKFFWNSAEKLI